MKRKFLLYLLLGMLTSCIAQKKNKEKHSNKEIMIPKIDKNFEIFDFYFFEKNKTTIDGLDMFKSESVYKTLDNGTFIEIIKSKNYSYSETPLNSFFMISKTYFLNGNIQSKGLAFNWSSFLKGLRYEFDESGNLIKETDYDKHYQFTFEEIVKFCENEKIPLQKGPILQNTGYHTVIRRNFNCENSWWQIEWLKKPNTIEIITLDGNTGKVLKRQEADYTNN
ncbi:hypothetical protein SAMN02927916_2297 [Flavobacterium anhuiense]|uniref:Lipoprotein n=1 Tax=Flavobacterium anhuiense TaxID=459526 RepID=A0ABY0LQA3_9FLAO|nr:hypothetical protein [Flavobacterium anhuiense]SCY49509.1 hypothetical protein SAMN02927916_2297 [Flavobacterium anhuiense]